MVAPDILAHAVFDPYPTVVETADQAADHLQERFEADAADGFMLNFDDFSTGIDGFVDQVIPLLREHGIFPETSDGQTLRDRMGLQMRYGPTPRLARAAG
ncbi:hypothetical protein AB0I35_31995 [Nocardia sp. NPDC050378]|uniref:hypothetical protein n=1 Tax=Nocardia sp. NPDC050378 TaxID=3155400 RepID=UPI003411D2D5